MGLGLGNKINKAVSMIGNKTNKISNSLGNKVNSVAAMNEKAIKFGNNLIEKSGNLTDALRKGTQIGDKFIQSAVNSGVANLPVVGGVIGTGLKAASQISGRVAQGAQKLDQIRDNAQVQLDKYGDTSRSALSGIEKMNQRKREQILQALDNSNNYSFA
jgi:hypothetical protein